MSTTELIEQELREIEVGAGRLEDLLRDGAHFDWDGSQWRLVHRTGEVKANKIVTIVLKLGRSP